MIQNKSVYNIVQICILGRTSDIHRLHCFFSSLNPRIGYVYESDIEIKHVLFNQAIEIYKYVQRANSKQTSKWMQPSFHIVHI